MGAVEEMETQEMETLVSETGALETPANQFVHLHLHSEFSLVDSTIRLKPLISEVVERGMAAVALTDQSNLFAMVKLYKLALASGVKPIFGADVWVYHAEREQTLSRLVLLCQNDVGYLNLKRLVSRAYADGQQADRPTIFADWLMDGASDGLIVLSAGLDGDVGTAIRNGNLELAETFLQSWKTMFPNRFFIELQRTGKNDEETYIHQALDFARQFEIPVVATNNVRFINADEFDSHEARVCINSGFTLDDNRRPKLYSEQQYLRSNEEMVSLFADIPQALQNSVNIAKACNVQLNLGQNFLPEYPVPSEHTTDSFFREVSLKGLEQRLTFLEGKLEKDKTLDRQEYYDRLNIELDVIINMGFPGYFLIVMDFIEWAKNHAIPVGPGRGSGAGSLVAYSLKITDLDPLEYELLFERFLNPERVSMPDFDIDFCMDRRDEVIEYVSQHYGSNQVSQIITYGTMAAKAVIRDVGRVLNHPYGFVDRLAKLIPFEIGMTIDKALEQEPDLLELYQNEEEVTMLIDKAKSLEGLTRNVGKHAGGVVIAPGDLTDFTATYCESGGGGLVSQFDKDDVEAIGLVKFDFLGLRTLTIIDWTLIAINKNRAAEDKLEIERIPLDDEATFELLQAYQTTAVFQLESRGMKDLIRRLHPDNFEEIIALVALFRPGPLQSGMVDDFINRKHGRQRVEYPHPALETILKPTYGVILYQEQVMQIAQILASYTLGGADMLRRAMGKKKPEEMVKQRVLFTAGALKNDVKEDTATYIFDLMEKFAGYGFNKSHSAAYALVSYQTAWLKTHYPADFMAAVLSADMDNTDKIVTLIEECREMKLEVQPPDVNQSEYRFKADSDGRVIYGLGAIKGVGEAAIKGIIANREPGPYQSLDEFCERVDTSKSNKKVMEALANSGAMDCFSNNRASVMAHLPKALQAAEQSQKNQDAGMVDMFETHQPAVESRALPTVPPWDEKTRLMFEKESLGLFLTGHPIKLYEKEIRQITPTTLGKWLEKLDPGDSISGFRRKAETTIISGLVIAIRSKNGVNGREVFVSLDDQTGRIDVRVFPELLEQIEPLVRKDQVWIVEGPISYDEFNNGIRMRAVKVWVLDQYRLEKASRLHIDLRDKSEVDINALQNELSPYRQSDALSLVFHHSSLGYEYRLVAEANWSIRAVDDCMLILEKYLGQGAFYVEYG